MFRVGVYCRMATASRSLVELPPPPVCVLATRAYANVLANADAHDQPLFARFADV